MIKTVILTSKEDAAQLEALSQLIFPGRLDIDSKDDGSCDGLVIFDPSLNSPDEIKSYFPNGTALLIPLLTMAQQIKQASSPMGSELHLNKPLDKQNFESTIGKAMDMLPSADISSRPPLSVTMNREFEAFLRGRFWHDVLLGVIKNVDTMSRGIHMSPEELDVLPILIEIKEWHKELTIQEKSVTLSLLINVANRIFLVGDDRGAVLQVKDDMLVALCRPVTENGLAKLTEDCLSFSDECSRLLSISACCCIGEPVQAKGLADMFASLVTLSRENITCEKLMFLRFGIAGKSAPVKDPDLTVWKNMLLAGEYDPMLISVTEYFLAATAANRLSFENLRRFSHDFQQMLYVVLQEKGVAAHVVFDNEKSESLWSDAADSVSELLSWMFWSVGEISKYLGSVDSRQDKLAEVAEYIKSNLSKELTRSELAGRVHLSQSALARMFKSGTGMTLTEYIFNERLETAKCLLKTTVMPIGEAAEKCGFRNYSYFYTRFKAAVGVSPSEYRAAENGDNLSLIT